MDNLMYIKSFKKQKTNNFFILKKFVHKLLDLSNLKYHKIKKIIIFSDDKSYLIFVNIYCFINKINKLLILICEPHFTFETIDNGLHKIIINIESNIKSIKINKFENNPDDIVIYYDMNLFEKKNNEIIIKKNIVTKIIKKTIIFQDNI